MGWLFTRNQTRKELVAENTHSWERTKEDGTHLKAVALKHCYRGNFFSGVLWTVWEYTYTNLDGTIKEVKRWIGCDLCRYQKNYGWGYKDMSESAHPFYYSCPLGYLNMVPVVCEEWRKGVREYHAKALEKRRNKKQYVFVHGLPVLIGE